MNPQDEVDFDKWYREEHLEMLSKIPGYRRSLRFELGPKMELTEPEVGKYMGIHEMDNWDGMTSEAAVAANTTPWTTKHIQESKPFVVRGWKLIHSQGF
jgi:hypothetical protein